MSELRASQADLAAVRAQLEEAKGELQIAEQMHRYECNRADTAQAEVDVLRGAECLIDGDGPCGVCIKCLRLRAEAAEATLTELRAGLEESEAARHDLLMRVGPCEHLAALTALRAERDAKEPQPADNSTIGSLKASMLRLLKDDTDLRAELAEARARLALPPQAQEKV
jgi:hypothetical protein